MILTFTVRTTMIRDRSLRWLIITLLLVNAGQGDSCPAFLFWGHPGLSVRH